MLHTKFQGHRSIGSEEEYILKVFTIYGHGGHLGHVTQLICKNCTAYQCSLFRWLFMGCSIINPALPILMKHLVIGQRQKAPNFLAFYWSQHRRLVSIGQHGVTTRVVHLLKRTVTSLITESDQIGPNHRIRPGCAGRA